MSDTPEDRLAALGLTLPPPARAVAGYTPFVISQGLIYVSGQLPFQDGRLAVTGHLGDTVSLEEGKRAAEICALNILAQLAGAAGSLIGLKQIVKVTGFVASTPSFTDQPLVINGASELLTSVLGEAGRHARAAVGVAALPLGAAVEVEAIAELA